MATNKVAAGSVWRYRLRQVRVSVMGRSHQIFIVHIRVVELTLAGVAFTAGLALLITLLYVAPPYAPESPATVVELNTDAIDRLITWIEVRERASETGLSLPPNTLLP